MGHEYSDLNEQVTQIQQSTLNLNREPPTQAKQEIARSLSEVEFASFETDRLKPNRSWAAVAVYSDNTTKCERFKSNEQRVETRDQVIIREIYRMFASVRDHQSANAKAHGELRQLPGVRRAGSWGYSARKRHVKAKVMDMPYAEASVGRRLGLDVGYSAGGRDR